jgi:hypothetical protein
MKIIAYRTVREPTLVLLEKSVVELLPYGWQPIGGVAQSKYPDWVQVMVKYEEEAK